MEISNLARPHRYQDLNSVVWAATLIPSLGRRRGLRRLPWARPGSLVSGSSSPLDGDGTVSSRMYPQTQVAGRHLAHSYCCDRVFVLNARFLHLPYLRVYHPTSPPPKRLVKIIATTVLGCLPLTLACALPCNPTTGRIVWNRGCFSRLLGENGFTS